VDIVEAQKFLADHHKGVLATFRRDGSLQLSPVSPGVDEEGRVIITSRETAYKVRNIRRDSRVSLCVFTEAFHGPWVRIDGTASVLSLPDAMEPLVDWHRRVKGEHTDWSQYRQTMQEQKRVLIRIVIQRAGPERRG
jgi:PPOX class probable F420-dependent enzyme